MLRGKTLEEIINKWTADLEANVSEFNIVGAEVAVWDRALIENGNNVSLEISSDLLLMTSNRLLPYIAMYWQQKSSKTRLTRL